jgi:hypothetical protein
MKNDNPRFLRAAKQLVHGCRGLSIKGERISWEIYILVLSIVRVDFYIL